MLLFQYGGVYNGFNRGVVDADAEVDAEREVELDADELEEAAVSMVAALGGFARGTFISSS